MRNRGLHDSLRAFALDAARVLSAAVEAGDELRFELEAGETPSRRSILYRYRPLTAEFVRARWDSLCELGSFAAAADALGSGSAAYLRAQGLAGGDAEPALLAMLERLYEDATDFGFPEERFERVYGEVERTLYDGVVQASLVAPLPGLVLDCERCELDEGLVLVRGDLLEAPAEAVWPAGDDGPVIDGIPYAVATIAFELPAGEPIPLPEVRRRLRRLVTALRLYGPGGVGCGEVGWVRSESGRWRPFPLHATGPARGAAWELRADDAQGLRDFVAHVDGWQPPPRVAWALRRFEMGCERGSAGDALTDYMLALRGLLDAADDAGRASLTLRAAALCAEQDERRALQLRMERIVALEHAVAAGVPFEVAADEEGERLVAELEDHLRALLRDVACGYLAPDLRAVADDLLLRREPFEEVRASDTRPRPVPEPAPEAAAEPAAPVGETERQVPVPEPRIVRIPWPERVPAAVGAPEPEPVEAPEPVDAPAAEPVGAAVPSAPPPQPRLVVDDFAWDLDDADDWSAPV